MRVEDAEHSGTLRNEDHCLLLLRWQWPPGSKKIDVYFLHFEEIKHCRDIIFFVVLDIFRETQRLLVVHFFVRYCTCTCGRNGHTHPEREGVQWGTANLSQVGASPDRDGGSTASCIDSGSASIPPACSSAAVGALCLPLCSSCPSICSRCVCVSNPIKQVRVTLKP